MCEPQGMHWSWVAPGLQSHRQLQEGVFIVVHWHTETGLAQNNRKGSETLLGDVGYYPTILERVHPSRVTLPHLGMAAGLTHSPGWMQIQPYCFTCTQS